MNFTRAGLEAAGYQGFVTLSELRAEHCARVPAEPGTYCVLLPDGMTPAFLDRSPAGRFKGKDPTVHADFLRSQWVEGALVIYIGGSNDLRRRAGQLLRFGAGHPVGHWGGRLIWQVSGSEHLLLAWALSADHQAAKAGLLASFQAAYGSLPFANLRPEAEG